MPRVSIEVTPANRSVTFPNGTRLESIYASGYATQFIPAGRGLRSAELPAEIDTSPDFERALQSVGFYEQETIHLEALPAPMSRSGSAEDTLVLRPAIPAGDTNRRVVLYVDDSGGLSWHFAENSRLTPEQRQVREERGLLRDEGVATFRIPARTTAARESLTSGPPRGALRGPVTKIGRKILKVLVLPLASKVLENPIDLLVGAVESRIRHNRVWRLTPDNYGNGSNSDFTDWAALDGKPTLLVVHGIFSSVEDMLSKLPRSVMERWAELYEGRVIGFNHLSVTLSPEDNARFFLETAKRAFPSGRLQFDVLCHSRGGIVSRTLAERGHDLFSECNSEFRKVYFVASPNKGSALGDPQHVLEMIDVFTNLVTEFPDSHTMFTIETILGVVKLLAYTAGVALPGMAAMATSKDGYIARVLNQSSKKSPARYAAAAASYAPRPGVDNGFFTDRFATYIMDQIFADKGHAVANDLVVPKDGVFAENGHPSFPIFDALIYSDHDAVWHGGFFSELRTIQHIEEHFEIAPQPLMIQEIPSANENLPRERSVTFDEYIPSLRGGTDIASTEIPLVPEVTVERRPEILFHEAVLEGDPNPLVVKLSEMADTTSIEEYLRLEFAAGQEQIELSVELSAPGFITDARSKPLIIKRERDSGTEEATFVLTAKNPGTAPVRREIVASFYRGFDCVGAATHGTTVVPKDYKGQWQPAGDSTFDPVVISARPRTESDLILFVRKDGTHPDTYEIEVKCNIPGEEYAIRSMGVLDLGGSEFSNFFSKVLDPRFQSFPNDPTLSEVEFNQAVAAWSAQFLKKLAELGRTLWDLLPPQFRDEYIRLMESRSSPPPRSICIYSDEMILPWELIRPSSMVNGQFKEYQTLGVAHVMARWMPSLGVRPQPQSLQVRKMVLLTPSYGGKPLYWATKESAELLKLFPDIDHPSPADLNCFEEVLDSDGFQVVHFNGHGEWDSTGDLASLRTSDAEAIQAMAFNGRKLGMTAHPILYLNACSVGRTTERLGQPGGFAANCLRNGWSGVIAPYWKIYDPQAMHFCVDLYRKLKSGISIGEALQQLRCDQPDNFTAQSYCYFGDPYARVLIK